MKIIHIVCNKLGLFYFLFIVISNSRVSLFHSATIIAKFQDVFLSPRHFSFILESPCMPNHRHSSHVSLYGSAYSRPFVQMEYLQHRGHL